MGESFVTSALCRTDPRCCPGCCLARCCRLRAWLAAEHTPGGIDPQVMVFGPRYLGYAKELGIFAAQKNKQSLAGRATAHQ